MELLVLSLGLSYLGYGFGFSIGYMEYLYPTPGKKPSLFIFILAAFAWPFFKGLRDGARN